MAKIESMSSKSKFGEMSITVKRIKKLKLLRAGQTLNPKISLSKKFIIF